ncbi:HD domain-containing phosphohydrolase [Halanaerobium sp. ST460_2HS_T2]|jgi:PAS domain S-box-containing protein/putative nucleotidyltransferase with HDIG domain|uniref:MEDS domain-containing protein n=1 Tax=Halanaerobium sp. ST460_2HS_T2 TaxID=2183914 RepID=UPI000DF370BF|nr:HD domain-containing phosphohydrolase [Halanaerobium sp. ST460_2HS_T2]RCW52998.1 PAS domain S-box-containing protein/putative nucleotidyltransferase with HDIG domain [Halanaerobium sp. ST460_2HS_T2]
MPNWEKEIKNIDLLSQGDHAVLFYEKNSDCLNSVRDFVINSLKENQKCYYIDQEENQELLLAELKNTDLDLEKYLETGQFLCLKKEEIYGVPSNFNAQKMLNLLEESVILAENEGYSGLSITGELTGVVDFSGGKEEIIKYEWQLNDRIFKKYPVTALCRYNINQFDNQIIKAAVELHDYIVWRGELHENPYYIDPEGYRQNKIEEYEIKSWLKNISEYQKKESLYRKAINQSQKRYLRLFNNSPVGIIKTTSRGKVLHINQRMAKIAGYDSVYEVIKKYDNLGTEFYVNFERRNDFLTELRNNDEVENFEFKAKKKNGEHIWLNMNAKIIKRNNDGSFIIEGFVFDISEKKEYEKEIKRRKEELSASNQQLQAYNEEIMSMNEELEDSFKELADLNNRFEKMISLVSDIENLSTISEEEFLSKILKQAVTIIPEAAAGSVYTFGQENVQFVDCIGYDLGNLKQNEIKNEAFYNYNSAIETMTAAEIKARNKQYMQPEDFESLKAESLDKIKEIMYFDLELNGEKKAGVTLDIKADSTNTFTINSKKIFRAFYNIASSFYKLKEYNLLQNNFTREIISSTIKMLEMYDLYTRGHSENVAELAVQIAEEMGLSQNIVDNIYWTGLVHDIGKMLIPLEVLNKEGKLSKSEYELIKEHPVLGSNALKSSSSLKQLADYVRYHHERWDGRGYPDGLKGDQIPIESQVICAADAWDAMRSKRTYREPLTFNHALAEIKDNKGLQFAPDVAEALINVLEI